MVDVGTLISRLPSYLPAEGMQATLRRNCCYIVSAVILRNDKIVLIQEAKLGCRGQWYLPAGRLELGETLAEGAKREVREEAGLEFNPTRIISMESSSPGWLRINFAGTATGDLKTFEDKESLQAKWFSVSEVLNRRIDLRAVDILPVIRVALEQDKSGFIGTLPVEIERPNFTVSLAVVCTLNDSDKVSIVTTGDGDLPTRAIPSVKDSKGRHLYDVFVMAELIFKEDLELESVDNLLNYTGVTTLAHDGRQGKDGMHFTLLYYSTSQFPLPSKYTWQQSCDHTTTCNMALVGEILSRKRVIPIPEN